MELACQVTMVYLPVTMLQFWEVAAIMFLHVGSKVSLVFICPSCFKRLLTCAINVGAHIVAHARVAAVAGLLLRKAHKNTQTFGHGMPHAGHMQSQIDLCLIHTQHIGVWKTQKTW